LFPASLVPLSCIWFCPVTMEKDAAILQDDRVLKAGECTAKRRRGG
jgi:hypothetical protein